jgi:hypothetical protein
MTLNITVTKKVLEIIVHETFSHFGFLSSSALLDSLKLLGFYYATNAGLSINIEDLKTPDLKKRYIQKANDEIELISQQWSEGKVSDQERFQSIIDSWNLATESLKNRIVDYYRDFDPANNLYIMAFSGARGNMSQVRQLVGMRGLMSDQEGKIIDLPIQANFREGLSSIDYIISSYGARKGIVDTALKTADSGYLTRRLIYLAQDLVIRENDCKTKKGILIFLTKKSSVKNLVGRHLLSAKEMKFPFRSISNIIENKKLEVKLKNDLLTLKTLEDLKNLSPLLLKIRSPLTCQSKGSLCQKCYGWDLAHQKLISLGESVGIIAAQSIGEPGTQLTMRTFHTGGIFTGETLKQIKAPFSGKIILPNSLKAISYRTNHGIEVLKIQQQTQIQLINWKGLETIILLEADSYLFVSQTSFVYEGQVIAEFLNQSIISGQRKLKPLYSRYSGKVICNGLIPTFRRTRQGKTRRILLQQGLLWIASGKIFILPIEAEFSFSNFLSTKKAIAKLKIITPKDGIILLNSSTLSIITNQNKITLSFDDFQRNFENNSIKFCPLVKNYQYVDSGTILAFLYIFPVLNTKIADIEQKQGKIKQTFLITTQDDIWNFYGSSIDFHYEGNTIKNRNYSFLKNIVTKEYQEIKKEKNNLQELKNSGKTFKVVSPSTTEHCLTNLKNSGLKKQQDRFFNCFQQLQSICLPTSTILNYIENDLVLEKKLFATLVHYSQQTDDIVQGLPKIEELIEARKLKKEAYLAKGCGIVTKFYSNESIASVLPLENAKGKNYPASNQLRINNKKSKLTNKFQTCLFFDYLPASIYVKNLSKKEIEKSLQILVLAHSFKKENILKYKDKFYKASFFSASFVYNPSIFSFSHSKLDIKFPFLNKKYEWFISEEKNLWLHSKKQLWTQILHSSAIENKKLFNQFEKLKYFQSLPPFFCDETIQVYSAENELLGTDYIIPFNKKVSLYLKEFSFPLTEYYLPQVINVIVKPGDFIDLGQPLTEGLIDSHNLLKTFFEYHCELDGMIEGTFKSLSKFQLILANSIQAIYQSQGVNISNNHIEIIVRQMTAKIIILKSGNSPFLPGEIISLSLIYEICRAFRSNKNYQIPTFEPKLISATNSSLDKDGFLSAAGFQETRKILTKAAIEGTTDWLRGLKESIMNGRMIPAGSAFLNYKDFLDNLYFLKK